MDSLANYLETIMDNNEQALRNDKISYQHAYTNKCLALKYEQI